eukprot:6204052-Pleurochrysis_carterae.AAC.2
MAMIGGALYRSGTNKPRRGSQFDSLPLLLKTRYANVGRCVKGKSNLVLNELKEDVPKQRPVAWLATLSNALASNALSHD